MPRLNASLCGLLLALLALHATATTAAPAQPTPAAPLCSLADPPAPLAQQLALEAHCALDPDFLLHLGTQLNHAQRYPEAVPRLESALLLRPDHAPTLLEFALALAGSGDLYSAQQTLLQLERSAALDAALQQQVRPMLQRLASASSTPPTSALSATPPRLRASLQLSLAHDTQLQALPRASSFELTLPSGSVWLQPEQPAPQTGAVLLADLHLSARLQPRWYARAQLGLRSVLHSSPGSQQPPSLQPEPQHERQHWGLGLAWVLPTQRPQQLDFSLRGIALGGRSVYQHSGLTWLHTLAPSAAPAAAQSPAAACAPTLGLELQQQRYPQLPVLDGHYTGLLWRQPCVRAPHLALPLPTLWLQARLGLDQPTQAQRPGGRQSLASLQLAWPHTAPAQPSASGWSAQLELTWLRDAHGYSPWLAHGQPRWQQRQHLRLEHRWPVGWPAPAWQAHVWADASRQRSNLALFDLRAQHSVGLGLRHSWQ